MKKVMRKVITILMMAVILAAVLPAGTEAAVTAPADVKAKAAAVMRENGSDVSFIIKLGADRKGTAYMFYRSPKGKVICDRSGAVILGKNNPYNKSYHYSFYRNRASEFEIMKWKKGSTQYRERYTSSIICAEGAAFDIFIHSYVEYKESGKAWKTCKGASKNVDGMAMCKEFARYIWSCADPGCPVAIM